MDSVHISRRSFVRHGAAVAFFGPGLVVCNRAPAAAAEEVSLRVVVPTRIYFPQRRRTTLGAYGSEVTTLALTADVLAVRFADGATIDLPADVSSAEHHRDGRGLAALQVKNLAAWLFDATRRSLGLRAFATAQPDLAGDFAELQTNRVLDSVTPQAVWELLVALEDTQDIARLRWTGKRFELSRGQDAGTREPAARCGGAGRRRAGRR
jgi:hypothetical protein